MVGAVEWDGSVAPFVVSQADAETVDNLLAVTTERTAKVVTDEYSAYHSLKRKGWDHASVCHGLEEYARGQVHTNTIEGFWSQIKRSIDDTHHGVPAATCNATRTSLRSGTTAAARRFTCSTPCWGSWLARLCEGGKEAGRVGVSRGSYGFSVTDKGRLATGGG